MKGKSAGTLLTGIALFAAILCTSLRLCGGWKPNIIFIMGDDIGWLNIGV
jgi:hypothetical protein